MGREGRVGGRGTIREREGKVQKSELQCDGSARSTILTLVLMLCAVVTPVIQL